MAYRRKVMLALVLGAACLAGAARADETPVQLVVPFAAGGSADQIARLVAAGLAQRLATPVVVLNKAGAGGTLAADFVAKAMPDAKTLLIGSNGPLVIGRAVYAKLPYDPQRDLVPVVALAETPQMLLVRRGTGIGSVAELLDHARKGEPPTMASAGNGSFTHLAGFYLSQHIGFTPRHIPYRGSAPAVNALLAGEVTMLYDSLPLSLQYAKEGGPFHALAITTAQRLPLLPDTPTFNELGLDVGKVTSWFGIAAPANTPSAAIARINTAANAVLAEAEVRNRLTAIGFDAMGGSPDDFEAVIQAETKRWIPLARSLRVTAD
jgi:tripartite-type tricarboxylate transporter receptor subunit TctC